MLKIWIFKNQKFKPLVWIQLDQTQNLFITQNLWTLVDTYDKLHSICPRKIFYMYVGMLDEIQVQILWNWVWATIGHILA
jgi:hypothetical protein